VYFDLRIARDVDGVVAIEIKRLAFGAYSCLAVETDQSRFVIVAVELHRLIAGGERDAAVMEKTRRGRPGRDCRAPPFAFVRLRNETRFRCDWVLQYFLVHEYSSQSL